MSSIIQIKNCSYRYPDSTEPALRNIDLEIERGSFVAVLGHNGSGKSTLAKLMNGILLPRNASQQARVGVPVELDALEPGDLLFFGTPAEGAAPQRISHVGIYMGDGVYIHSSQVVRISALDPEDEDYGGREPLCARRILGHVDDGHGVVSIAKSPYYFSQSE